MLGMDTRWQPGQHVIWIHTGFADFGYAERVPAIVIRVTPKRVVIEVRKRDGQLARHPVSPVHLQSPD